jgi:bacterioferritin-associated ferredoxin
MEKKAKNENPVFVCRCEEVTEMEVRQAIRAGVTSVDGIKRATRAGMGLCQSKTCYLNVARIINDETGIPMDELEPIKIRIPVRPIKVTEKVVEEQ